MWDFMVMSLVIGTRDSALNGAVQILRCQRSWRVDLYDSNRRVIVKLATAASLPCRLIQHDAARDACVQRFDLRRMWNCH